MSRQVTADELSTHTERDDCWVAVYGKVYNVTSFLNSHPGGAGVLLYYAGGDATEEFKKANHSAVAKGMMPQYLVGDLVKGGTVQRPITADEFNQHSSEESCWICIDNNVYDVTAFLYEHPGTRDSLVNNSGGDATDAFTAANHSDNAKGMMKQFKIGHIVGSTLPSTVKPVEAPKAVATSRSQNIAMFAISEVLLAMLVVVVGYFALF
jgi:cytochrome b5